MCVSCARVVPLSEPPGRATWLGCVPGGTGTGTGTVTVTVTLELGKLDWSGLEICWSYVGMMRWGYGHRFIGGDIGEGREVRGRFHRPV
jgi:hypothetical protein